MRLLDEAQSDNIGCKQELGIDQIGRPKNSPKNAVLGKSPVHIIYIAYTARALHIRAREHLYNIEQKEADKSGLPEHYINQHHTATESPEIKFKVLCSTRDGLRLRIEEAYWIRRLQSALNRKEEDMGTGVLA